MKAKSFGRDALHETKYKCQHSSRPHCYLIFSALSSIYPENKTYNMLGAHLSKTKDKKKLLIILAIVVILLLAGILLLTKSV